MIILTEGKEAVLIVCIDRIIRMLQKDSAMIYRYYVRKRFFERSSLGQKKSDMGKNIEKNNL